jgi:hypothetical protein
MSQVCRVAQPAVAPCPVVGTFDAELYLRLQGEEMLLGAREHRRGLRDAPLVEPARALVAVDAISATNAETVIDDYALAEALRTEHGLESRRSFGPATRRRKRKIKPLEPRRVVPCDHVIGHGQGTLEIRRVSLAEHFTRIAVTWRPNTPQYRSRRRGGMISIGLNGGAAGPPHPTVVDDQGTRSGTEFSGGGSELESEGRLTTDRPLARNTAWIEIDGTRVELAAQPAEWSVSIDELPEQPAAHAYLWRRLAIRNHFHELESLDLAIEALLAAGALEPDDPVIDEVRAVLEAMPRRLGMPYGGRAQRQVPQPWRSLLSRQGREDGPEGTIALAAVTPVFDGFSVAVGSVESRPDGFQIEADVTSGTEDLEAFGWGVRPRQLAWWAADDRDNHYLGQIQSWNGGEDHSSCDIHFWPPLHPKASTLRIMPTGEKSRAVITVPLAWDEERSASEEAST